MSQSTQLALFAGIPSTSNIVAAFTVHGEPASKARPRFDHRGSKSHAYTPARTKAAEAKVAAAFLEQTHRRGTDPDITYGISAHFFSGTRQRRDVDNMLKLVLDGLNKVAFPDDVQVTEVIGRKSFTSKSEARTEVIVYVVGTVERLTKKCAHCGAEFVTWPSLIEATKYCSADCRQKHRREQCEATCENCGKTFQARGHKDASSRRFCSRECHAEFSSAEVACSICGKVFRKYRSWIRERNYCSQECARANDALVHKARRSKHFPGTCAICGAGTTRKEYRRCNPCKLAGIPVPAAS